MTGTVLPGPIRQIGYVVNDFDQALASWLRVDIGPWYVIRARPQRAIYRGQPCEVTLSIGFANSGDLQLEVIHQEDDTPSVFTEFLSSGRDGFHQLAWWTDDFVAVVHRAEATGWPVVWSGGEGEGPRVRLSRADGRAGHGIRAHGADRCHIGPGQAGT